MVKWVTWLHVLVIHAPRRQLTWTISHSVMTFPGYMNNASGNNNLLTVQPLASFKSSVILLSSLLVERVSPLAWLINCVIVLFLCLLKKQHIIGWSNILSSENFLITTSSNPGSTISFSGSGRKPSYWFLITVNQMLFSNRFKQYGYGHQSFG